MKDVTNDYRRQLADQADKSSERLRKLASEHEKRESELLADHNRTSAARLQLQQQAWQKEKAELQDKLRLEQEKVSTTAARENAKLIHRNDELDRRLAKLTVEHRNLQEAHASRDNVRVENERAALEALDRANQEITSLSQTNAALEQQVLGRQNIASVEYTTLQQKYNRLEQELAAKAEEYAATLTHLTDKHTTELRSQQGNTSAAYTSLQEKYSRLEEELARKNEEHEARLARLADNHRTELETNARLVNEQATTLSNKDGDFARLTKAYADLKTMYEQEAENYQRNLQRQRNDVGDNERAHKERERELQSRLNTVLTENADLKSGSEDKEAQLQKALDDNRRYAEDIRTSQINDAGMAASVIDLQARIKVLETENAVLDTNQDRLEQLNADHTAALDAYRDEMAKLTESNNSLTTLGMELQQKLDATQKDYNVVKAAHDETKAKMNQFSYAKAASRNNDIEALTQQLSDVANKSRELEDALRALQDKYTKDVNDLKQQLADKEARLQATIEKAEQEYAAFTEQIMQLEAELSQRAFSRGTRDSTMNIRFARNAELRRYEREALEAKATLKRTEREMQTLRNEIAALQGAPQSYSSASSTSRQH
jgi:chromosome segregation ATPase